jgi:hypothetical protein
MLRLSEPMSAQASQQNGLVKVLADSGHASAQVS